MNEDELHKALQAAQDEIAGHLKTIRSQSGVIGKLNRETDPEKRAKEHELWDIAQRLFDFWRRESNHPRSKFSADRFQLVRPFIEGDGVEMCVRAIKGRCYDPWKAPRKNGTMQVFNRWEDCFGDRGKFEESCNRMPFDAKTLEEDLAEVEARS